jgi:hypothetical protein
VNISKKNQSKSPDDLNPYSKKNEAKRNTKVSSQKEIEDFAKIL